MARILLIDDDPEVVLTLSAVLRGANHTVVCLDQASGALGHVERASPDLVITDWQMPGMHGLDLARAISALPEPPPVVLMTGSPTVLSARDALDIGVFRYLTKPVDCDVLLHTVECATHTTGSLQAFGSTSRPVPYETQQRLQSRFERALRVLRMVGQPIVHVPTGERRAFEMLVRANPVFDSPNELLAAAEQIGEVARLSRAIRAAVSQIADVLPPTDTLFVNLHPQDLMDDQLYEDQRPLSRHADRVVLEITERYSVESIPGLQGRLSRLKAMGYRIAVDDLGSGYASLQSLVMLQPDVAKLDQSLVRRVAHDPGSAAVVSAVRGLCSRLGISVVAEGIERPEDRDALLELGCDLMQGYFFARPTTVVGNSRSEALTV